MRADRTGGMIFFCERLEEIEHASCVVPVHEPSPPELLKSTVNPSYMSALVIDVLSFVRVGKRWRPSESVK